MGAELAQLPARDLVGRLELQGLLEVLDRLPGFVPPDVDAREVEVREVPRLVAGRPDRLLEPGDRLAPLPQLDEVRADVVVRVSELRVDLDRLLALLDRLVVAALKAVRPAQVGVRLGGRANPDRLTVVLDRLVELPGHLERVRL